MKLLLVMLVVTAFICSEFSECKSSEDMQSSVFFDIFKVRDLSRSEESIFVYRGDGPLEEKLY